MSAMENDQVVMEWWVDSLMGKIFSTIHFSCLPLHQQLVNSINLIIQLSLNFTKYFAILFNMFESGVSQLQTLLQGSHNLHCLC
jgi:hypothetical protein